MEAVLKNVSSTVELLAAAAQSEAVEQWDEQTLSRAFHWAQYCEHLFLRFHSNQAVRMLLEKQLQVTNQSVRAALPGCNEVSFPDLSRCRHLLLVGLLHNPKLPSSMLKILFDTESPVNIKDNDYQDATGVCSHIIQYRSACKVLKPLSDRSTGGAGADAEVQGMLLVARLAALLSRGGEACRAEHFLDSVLQGCEGAEEHFCLVIAAALLTPTNAPGETASQEFLLNWLQQRDSVLQPLCSALPTTLLVDLARKHEKFRDAHIGLVKKWASDMEYSTNDGVWIQSNRNLTVSFQKLTEHFLALSEACPSMSRNIEKELTALKVSDGNYDVRGLSIWGDLLTVINSSKKC